MTRLDLNARSTRIAGLTLICSLIVSSLLMWRYETYRQNSLTAQSLNVATNYAYKVSVSLDRALSVIHTVKALVYADEGAARGFDAVGRVLTKSYPDVSRVALAPQGIISQVYPSQDNARAIGVNLMTHPSHKRDALLARHSRTFTLSDPLDVFGGEPSVMAHMPIFLDDDHFWGFAVVVVEEARLIELSQLHQLQARGFSYELWRDGLNGRHVIASSERALDRADIVTRQISVPNGEWHLSVSVNRAWPVWVELLLLVAINITLSTLFALLMKLVLEARERTRELELAAYTDPLTNLPNRRLLREHMERAFAFSDRHATPVAICYLDLDDFKPVNDQYGHDAGDLLLVTLAERFASQLRATDTIARLGGDEFVIVLQEFSENLDPILQRIIDHAQAPVAYKGEQLQVSASVGVTLYPQGGVDAETLLRQADLAMYAAKMQGKAGYLLYSELTPQQKEQALKRC